MLFGPQPTAFSTRADHPVTGGVEAPAQRSKHRHGRRRGPQNCQAGSNGRPPHEGASYRRFCVRVTSARVRRSRQPAPRAAFMSIQLSRSTRARNGGYERAVRGGTVAASETRGCDDITRDPCKRRPGARLGHGAERPRSQYRHPAACQAIPVCERHAHGVLAQRHGRWRAMIQPERGWRPRPAGSPGTGTPQGG